MAVAALLATAVLPGCAQARPAPVADPSGFLKRFLDPAGRVVDTGNGGISHSEGQGYGLLIAEATGDRAGFDRIWAWTRATLMRPDGLFSWRYDPRAARPVGDPNNATDGDILIAWALLRASRRWPGGDYGGAGRAIRDAVAAKLIVDRGGRAVLLPGLTGFLREDRLTLNPSYYVWPALDAFAKADGGRWTTLVRDGDLLMRQARFGASALPTDWIDIGADGRVAPAADKPARFGFDAIRVPLYLAWSGRKAGLTPFVKFWSGFTARDAPVPAWIDVASGEIAPYPLSDGAQAIVRLVAPSSPARPRLNPAAGDYYSSVLATLAWLAAKRA
ncbi:MAG: glycosyl hydrolase family 8 [Sphingomonas sp.]